MIDKNTSRKILLQYQFKSGAFPASPNFEHYGYCWLRDSAFIAYALMIVGEQTAAKNFFRWGNRVILKYQDKVFNGITKANQGIKLHPDDLLHTRYKLDGEEGTEPWGNFQLDGYGTYLWALGYFFKHFSSNDLLEESRWSIQVVVEYIIRFWHTGCLDCWEETQGVHAATLATIYAGLKASSPYMSVIQERHAILIMEAVKEKLESDYVENGHFIANLSEKKLDASLIWMAVPFEVISVDNRYMKNTVEKIEKQLLSNGGVKRYFDDNYYGGGSWLPLTAWVGWYYLKKGNKKKAMQYLEWVESKAENGELAEQVTDINSTEYVEWRNKWGEIAKPLLWSHAMHLILRHEYEDYRE